MRKDTKTTVFIENTCTGKTGEGVEEAAQAGKEYLSTVHGNIEKITLAEHQGIPQYHEKMSRLVRAVTAVLEHQGEHGQTTADLRNTLEAHAKKVLNKTRTLADQQIAFMRYARQILKIKRPNLSLGPFDITPIDMVLKYLYAWEKSNLFSTALSDRSKITSSALKNEWGALLEALLILEKEDPRILKDLNAWEHLATTIVTKPTLIEALPKRNTQHQLLSRDWPKAAASETIETAYETIRGEISALIENRFQCDGQYMATRQAMRWEALKQLGPFPFALLYEWSLHWALSGDDQLEAARKDLYQKLLFKGAEQGLGATLRKAGALPWLPKQWLPAITHRLAHRLSMASSATQAVKNLQELSRAGYLSPVAIQLIDALFTSKSQLAAHSTTLHSVFQRGDAIEQGIQAVQQRLTQLINDILIRARSQVMSQDLLRWMIHELSVVKMGEAAALYETIQDKAPQSVAWFAQLQSTQKRLYEIEEKLEEAESHTNSLLKTTETIALIAAGVKLQDFAMTKKLFKALKHLLPMVAGGVELLHTGFGLLIKEGIVQLAEVAKASTDVAEGLETACHKPLDWLEERWETFTKDLSLATQYKNVRRYFPAHDAKAMNRAGVLTSRLLTAYQDVLLRLSPQSFFPFLDYLLSLALAYLKQGTLPSDLRRAKDDHFADAVLYCLGYAYHLEKSSLRKFHSAYPNPSMTLANGQKVKAIALLSRSGLLCQDKSGRVFRFSMPGQVPHQYGYRLALPNEVDALNEHIQRGYRSGAEKPPQAEGEKPRVMYYRDNLSHYQASFCIIPRQCKTLEEKKEARLCNVERGQDALLRRMNELESKVQIQAEKIQKQEEQIAIQKMELSQATIRIDLLENGSTQASQEPDNANAESDTEEIETPQSSLENVSATSSREPEQIRKDLNSSLLAGPQPPSHTPVPPTATSATRPEVASSPLTRPPTKANGVEIKTFGVGIFNSERLDAVMREIDERHKAEKRRHNPICYIPM